MSCQNCGPVHRNLNGQVCASGSSDGEWGHAVQVRAFLLPVFIVLSRGLRSSA